jgi:hypothetical protein
MKEPSDRLPPYVSDLLAVERAAPPPSRKVQDRVRARVAATVVAGAVTGGAATATAAKGASAGALASLAAAKATVIAVVAVTATGGVALHRHRARTAEVVRAAEPRVARPVPDLPTAIPVASQPTVPVVVTAPEAVAVEPRPAPLRSRSPVAAAPRVDQEPARGIPDRVAALADENALIDAARASLGKHDAAEAAILLEKHARSHPAGQMEEEREALWVQVLVARGQGAEARARAAAFQKRFPQSIQIEVVSAALETIP